MALRDDFLTAAARERTRRRRSSLTCTGLVAVATLATSVGFAQSPRVSPDFICPPAPVMTEHDGALDYRLRFTDERVRVNVGLVDKFHTWPARETMASGVFGRSQIGDLDFSLRHSPNHAEALKLLVDYDRAGGKPFEYGPVPCYFVWAHQFVPDDPNVLALAGLYYWRRNDLRRSVELFDAALALDPTSSELQYNAGLLYLELGDYPRARRHAKAAYDSGFPLPGLRTRLQKLGQWSESDTGEQSSPR